MSQEKNAFRDAAIEAISDMAQHLPLDCELLVVACCPGKKEFDLVLPSPCLLYTSPSPRDGLLSRMPSSA